MGWNPLEWIADTVTNTFDNTIETAGGAFSKDKRKRQKFYTALGTMGMSLGAESAIEASKGSLKAIAESDLSQDIMNDIKGTEPEPLTEPQQAAKLELRDPRRRRKGGSTDNFATLTNNQGTPSLIG